MTEIHTNLKLYNSLARSKQAFEPLQPGHVGIYVCGPTVYGDAHLGHAKSYVSFDVLVRYMRHAGFNVRYVQNITDVGHLTDDADEGEDKLEKQARLDRVHPMEVAERYTRSYLEDMVALKVQHADIYPRATQHIPEQIALIRNLVESGHAYQVGGNVYFSVKSFPDYGKLSGRQIDESREGTRVGARTDKQDPRDFALWKAAESGHILQWESPWGWGYPGWHVECSAMATKYLGETFDIHGGGIENKFPHHECEIAQSESNGDGFARFWIHNNMINVDAQKMGKSLGNFVTIKQALETHSAEAIRLFILNTHYRAPANYTIEALDSGSSGVERLANGLAAIERARKKAPDAETASDDELRAIVADLDQAFHAAMDDDINTPGAIAALFEFVRRMNVATTADVLPSRPALDDAAQLFCELAEGVLGLIPVRGGDQADDAEPYIDLLLEVRARCKQEKAFELADLIRARLTERGIEIKDSKEGSEWSRK